MTVSATGDEEHKEIVKTGLPTFSVDGGDERPVKVQDDVDESSSLELIWRHDSHEVTMQRLVTEVFACRRVTDLRYVEQW